MQDPTLTQEVLSRLDALAAELGVAVEYLWPALVEHSFATGLTNVLCGAFLLAASAVCTFGARFFQRRSLKCGGLDRTDLEFAMTVCAFIAIVGAIVGAFTIVNGLPDLIAPEGAALRKLF